MKHFSCTEEYIAQFGEPVRSKLEQIRRIIQTAAPGAVETISYNMPAFKTSKVLVYFAAAGKHLGFYPTGEGIQAFEEEFIRENFRFSKGALQLPYNRDIPEDLIRRIVEYRLASVGQQL